MCTTYPPREPFWGPFWGPFPEGISLAGMFGETLISRVVSSMLSEMSFCVVLVTPLKGLNQGLIRAWAGRPTRARPGSPRAKSSLRHPSSRIPGGSGVFGPSREIPWNEPEMAGITGFENRVFASFREFSAMSFFGILNHSVAIMLCDKCRNSGHVPKIASWC